MIQIHEVTHTLSELTPFSCELHHVFTTALVIFLYRDVFLALLVVNIFFGNAEFLLNAQFYWQSMCVPTSLTVHLETLHGLIAIECILDAACQHMVDARMSIRRRRSLIEHKLWTALTLINRLMEHIVLHPLLENPIVDFRKI